MADESGIDRVGRDGHVLAVEDRCAPPSADLLDLLDAWLPRRRWFPVKDVAVETLPWVSYALPSPPGLVTQSHLLRLVGDGVDLVIHVPVVLERVDGSVVTDEPEDAAVIGVVRGEDGTLLRVHDGAAHPAFWLASLETSTWDVDPGELSTQALASGRLLRVEQSNSSVRLPDVAGGVMFKVMRAVAIGPNPDVTLPRALAHGGWRGVPRPLAWLTGTWEDDDTPSAGADLAHLVIVAELIGSARDGFDLACSYARQGESFADLAADLGEQVARMHAALRDVLPVGEPLDVDWLFTDLRRRATEAAQRAPLLARTAADVAAFYDDAERRLAATSQRPVLQHVHGDLHLGQALNSRELGWKVLDFEGEPLRPVAERTRADLVMRDVAGVLRSFDYAAAVGGAQDPRWVVDARTAFLAAYRREARFPDEHEDAAETLVRALVLDKALYEVVYESTNRPTWTWIPLEAVDRLLRNEI
ncbi:maltokinase [Paraoerskovia marina]|uniref:Maltokinase n=1 Tax=Paraoerskovia marina TaxID=545619 RepID=A0A1H1R7Z2_9CELL|nr:aminoglycoside phosphotransferase [Paraoerskovia marina]SDS31813.1 maltokinase [Paraoerskovia marina]